MPKPPEAEIKGAGKAAGGTKPKSGIRYANGGFTHAVPAKIRLPIRCYNPPETDDTKKEHLMNTPQSAIIPDHAQAGIFIEADFAANRLNDIKAACRASLDALS
ncbi:TPA: peroxidase, partial [Neisseria gonorrhoeae]